MSNVEGCDLTLPESLGQRNDAGVDLIERQVGVVAAEIGDPPVVDRLEVEHLELGRRDALEETHVRFRSVTAGEEERRLGHHRRGEHQLLAETLKQLSTRLMTPVPLTQSREDRPAVTDQHERADV